MSEETNTFKNFETPLNVSEVFFRWALHYGVLFYFTCEKYLEKKLHDIILFGTLHPLADIWQKA